jgi:hypothetical protein
MLLRAQIAIAAAKYPPIIHPFLTERDVDKRRFRIRLGILLHRMSPFLAQSGHPDAFNQCPLLGVKRTWINMALMSAFDPKRTSSVGQREPP